MLGLVLTLPKMSTKQPLCLATMGDLLSPDSKTYFGRGYIRTNLIAGKEASVRKIYGMERFMFATPD